MHWYWIGIGMFGGGLLLLLSGIPVSFVLLSVAIISLIVQGGISLLADLPGMMFHHFNSFSMTCVPLFVFMAACFQESGFARSMFDTIRKWLNRLPGSVALIGIFCCTIFAAVTGSSAANAMAIGTIAIPQHKRLASDRRLATGSLAAGGSLGILIPPSLCGIFYCIIAEQSIGHLFVAGVLPGLLTAAMFTLYVIVKCRLDPELMPSLEGVSWRERWRSLVGLAPSLMIILTVMGSIYLGIATITEAAGLGCLSAALLGVATGRVGWGGLLKAGLTTARLTGFLMLIVVGAIAFGVALNRANVGTELIDTIQQAGVSKWGVLILMQIVWAIMGCFMDPTPIILTTMPTFFPIAHSLGFDPIWFGIVAIMNLELAAITPPVGFNLFIIKEISGDFASMGDIILGSMPFVAMYLVALVAVIIFPALALFLPGRM